MDIARAPQKKTGRNVAIGGGILAVAVITIVLSRLQPAAPSVDAATILMDSVRLGDMVIEVRGPGNLVPERIRWITALASARVDRLVAQSGEKVAANAVLLELSNPDVEIQALQAEQQLNQARSDLIAMRTNLNSNRFSQEGLVATTHTQWVNASQDAMAVDSLYARKLASVFERNSKQALAEELTVRFRVEQARLKLLEQSVDSQVAVQAAQVERLKAIAEFQRNRLRSLQVRAPEGGTLQELTLQIGQWGPEGTTLAKIVQPGKLKAVLRIPETQAKDVQIGQSAQIDTRNGIVAGHVARKDPSSVNGTVTVDVSLDGALPAGAVPDLSVDGTVRIAQLTHVLYTGRPAYGSGTGMVGLFRVVEGGGAAVRTPVTLGRSSVTTVEIVRGLKLGDRVILSDMSPYDNADRVRLK